jgi:hypothetical protein
MSQERQGRPDECKVALVPTGCYTETRASLRSGRRAGYPLSAASKRLLLLVSTLAAGALLFGCNSALAAPVPTWTHVCTDTAVADPDECERLDYIASELSAIDANTTISGSPTASEVVLAEPDQQRLDLMWWGIWIALGLTMGTWVFGRGWKHFKGWGG